MFYWGVHPFVVTQTDCAWRVRIVWVCLCGNPNIGFNLLLWTCLSTKCEKAIVVHQSSINRTFLIVRRRDYWKKCTKRKSPVCYKCYNLLLIAHIFAPATGRVNNVPFCHWNEFFFNTKNLLKIATNLFSHWQETSKLLWFQRGGLSPAACVLSNALEKAAWKPLKILVVIPFSVKLGGD